MREDVTSSNQDMKTNVATLVCRRGVQGSCLSFVVFLPSFALEKNVPSGLCVVSLDDVTSSLNPTLSFELSNVRQLYREFVVQTVGLLVKVMA